MQLQWLTQITMLKWNLAEYTEIIVVKLIRLAQVHINGYALFSYSYRWHAWQMVASIQWSCFHVSLVLLHVWPVA